MSLLVTGSIGIDSVTTPHGSATDVLGGTAVYFSFAASYYTPVRLVGVVGEDFPPEFRSIFEGRDIDLAGLETRAGSKTFRWRGKFVGDMNEAETLDVALNVLSEKGPTVPPEFADSEFVFLANTHPTLQRALLGQLTGPKLSVCDTMNLWIANEREELIKTLMVVDGVILNDGEARQLTDEYNLVRAGDQILKLGPKFAIIKKGEHGALLVSEEGPAAIPAFPTRDVRDPTGAGDSFAGGTLGYLAACGEFGINQLKRAMVRGTIAASFAIEAFSLDRVLKVSQEEIDTRVERFLNMIRIE